MDYDKYENKLKYPTRKLSSCPNCNTTFSNNDNFCSSCGGNIKEHWKKICKDHERRMKKYNEEEKRIKELFKHDALGDVGLLNHPKVDKIYKFAWDHGCGTGFHEIYYWLLELAELFED